jgi:hypothetical protein
MARAKKAKPPQFKKMAVMKFALLRNARANPINLGVE